MVGLYEPEATNIRLYPQTIDPTAEHAYSYQVYGLSVVSPLDCILGFARTAEWQLASPEIVFPPVGFEKGALYAQVAPKEHPLQFQLGSAEDKALVLDETAAVHSDSKIVNIAGFVTAEAVDLVNIDWTGYGSELAADAFNFAADTAQRVETDAARTIQLVDSTVTRLIFGPRTANAMNKGKTVTSGIGAEGSVGTAWMQFKIPTDAPLLTFDFKLTGNPLADSKN